MVTKEVRGILARALVGAWLSEADARVVTQGEATALIVLGLHQLGFEADETDRLRAAGVLCDDGPIPGPGRRRGIASGVKRLRVGRRSIMAVGFGRFRLREDGCTVGEANEDEARAWVRGGRLRE